MPLATGSSQAVISSNIAELITAGHSHSKAQAAAIAYKTAGKDSGPEDRKSLVQQFREFAARFAKFLDEEADEPAHQGEDGEAKPAPVDTSRAHDEAPIAFDRAPDSARDYDANGYLHVAETNISKANICPYYGNEIPNAEALGLDPSQQYMLLRDPVELERAADTFKGLPLLWRHTPVSSEDHPADIVIGSIGDDVQFEKPYLKASLHIWPKYATDAIESAAKKELSCGYQYKPDMTPGEYEGQSYDGVMRDIVGNHVALVESGRAGPDVMVGDENPQESQMKKGLRVAAALLKEKLGLDKSIEDVVLALDAAALEPNGGVPPVKKAEDDEDETEEERKKREAADKKAKDAEEDDKDDDDKGAEDSEEDDEEEAKKKASDKKARDARRARDAKAHDEEKDDEPVSRKAMDAALAAHDTEVRAGYRALRAAETAVRPYVGELAMDHDSADQVYRTALKMLGVADVEKIHPSAYSALLAVQPKPGARAARIATDSAPSGEVPPELARITIL